MAVVQGLVDTFDIMVDPNLELPKKLDVSEEFSYLEDDDTQFMNILTRFNKREAIRERINWGETNYLPRLSAASAGIASGVTALVVTAGQGTYFTANDIVRNAVTGEAFRVTAVATDTLTIVRGIGAVAAAAIATTDQLVIVGNASPQGATLPTRRIMLPTFAYNYTEIIRNSAGFTGTEEAIAQYGGSPSVREEKAKFVEHKRFWQSTFFFGPRSYNSSGATPLGTAGGMTEFVTSNVFNVAGQLTSTLLDNYLRQAMQYGSRNKILVAGPIAAQHISGFLKTAWAGGATPVGASKGKYGAFVDGYTSGAFGYEIPVIVQREWGPMALTGYAGWAFIVDLDHVTYRPLRGRDTALLRNRQAPDADESTWEYRTEATFEIRVEQSHAILKNIAIPT